MKCPNDNTQMEQGIYDRGMWFSNKELSKPLIKFQQFFRPSSTPVISWKCPKCGKIEFYAC